MRPNSTRTGTLQWAIRLDLDLEPQFHETISIHFLGEFPEHMSSTAPNQTKQKIELELNNGQKISVMGYQIVTGEKKRMFYMPQQVAERAQLVQQQDGHQNQLSVTPESSLRRLMTTAKNLAQTNRHVFDGILMKNSVSACHVLGSVMEKLESVSTGQDALCSRMNSMESKISKLDDKIENLGLVQDALCGRMISMESKISQFGDKIEFQISTALDFIEARLNAKIAEMTAILNQGNDNKRELEVRIEKLESMAQRKVSSLVVTIATGSEQTEQIAFERSENTPVNNQATM